MSNEILSIPKNYLHRSTDEIEYFKITMYRPTMDKIPSYSFPTGYSLRLYKKDSNDEYQWAKIVQAAGEFCLIEEAEALFKKDYLSHPKSDLLTDRLYFLVNAEGQAIGTAMAWFGEFNGEEQGSLHWVAIIPEYQGKKLAKPMLSIVLKKIAEYSNKSYLGSQTTSWRAINMYADFGFLPNMNADHSDKAWKLLNDICHRDFLSSS